MNILDFARVAALFASATLLAATGASAQEGMFAKDLLGSVGIIPKERPRIDYRERAPLVLPPIRRASTPRTRNGRTIPMSSPRSAARPTRGPR